MPSWDPDTAVPDYEFSDCESMVPNDEMVPTQEYREVIDLTGDEEHVVLVPHVGEWREYIDLTGETPQAFLMRGTIKVPFHYE